MYDFYEDPYYDENHILVGHDDSGNSVNLAPDSEGDYRRTKNDEGEDVIEDGNGYIVGYVHTYD